MKFLALLCTMTFSLMVLSCKAVLGAVPVGETKECETFPSSRQIYVALRGIHEDFLRSEPGRDCWSGFVPLLEQIVKHRNKVSAEEAKNAEDELLSRFTLYSFACENDGDAAKADFHGRLECLRLICGFGIVQSETNALFRLADWLGSAAPVDRRRGEHCIQRVERV